MGYKYHDRVKSFDSLLCFLVVNWVTLFIAWISTQKFLEIIFLYPSDFAKFLSLLDFKQCQRYLAWRCFTETPQCYDVQSKVSIYSYSATIWLIFNGESTLRKLKWRLVNFICNSFGYSSNVEASKPFWLVIFETKHLTINF